MNLSEIRYNKFALVREMMETPAVIREFKQSATTEFVSDIKSKKGLLLCGEGSSRIFPAKRAIYDVLRKGLDMTIITEGSTQAQEYDLDNFAVFAASNSGKTGEVIRLISQLKENGHNACFGLSANKNTILEQICDNTHILNCGKEDAVAATKSVIEQALFYDGLLHSLSDNSMNDLNILAGKMEQTLGLSIEKEITDIIAGAEIIYFAGRNTGVAEELTLKTNEICRKKSEFLEGTYGVHGIEEVMDKDEVIIWINPFPEEEDKFDECLIKGVGLKIIAISDHQTKFPTIIIPDGGKYSEYIEMAAGWNILVETGLSLGIDLDKPQRARKVGNEFQG